MKREVRDAFLQQAEACRSLGSPLNGLVCQLLGERLDGSTRFGQLIGAWPGPPVSDALALRAAGALHGLVRSGQAPLLAAQYALRGGVEREGLWAAIAEELPRHEDFLCEYLSRPPQTNEVARSSVLLGAALLIAERTGLALDWHEMGASAGLNLAFDRYRHELGSVSYGDAGASVVIHSAWQGRLPPMAAALHIAERAGADVEPLDPRSAAHRERLASYIWPDQTERLQRTLAALELAAAAPWRVERQRAADWVTKRFSLPLIDGRVRVLAHTVVWQYLSLPERDAVTQAMNEAGARATARAGVAWFGMEADAVPEGAGLQLTLWPGGERTLVGRADFHARWVRWF